MRVASAAILATLVIAGCAAKEPAWVRTRDDAQSLKSATYWCTKQRLEKYHKQHPDTTRRAKRLVVDEKCMNRRGWRQGK